MEIESPSDNKAAGDGMGALLAARLIEIGGKSRLHRTSEYADNLQIDFPGPGDQEPVLLLGHFDTVYPLGTLSISMPCHTHDGGLYGPGVLDMKSGIALMMYAIQALQMWHGMLPRPITVFLVSDEEVGRSSSRTKLLRNWRKPPLRVLVLEPAAGHGAVKTARKGVADTR